MNLSVIKHYIIDNRERGGASMLTHLVLPLIGFVLTVWLWTSLSWLTLKVGLIWLAAGFLWLLWVTRGFQRATPVLDIEE